MRILSLDTSFSFINFSVIEEGKLTLLKYVDNDKKTLQNLPSVLEEENIKPRDFDAFAVSKGVGYLTSLRIGITFMKTLAYLNERPILSYENLLILGLFTPLPPPKVAFLKVSNNIFYREFTEEASQVRLFKGEKLTGSGITLSQFRESLPLRKVFTYPLFPFSAYGGLWAWERFKNNPEGEDPFLLEPIYLKPPI